MNALDSILDAHLAKNVLPFLLDDRIKKKVKIREGAQEAFVRDAKEALVERRSFKEALVHQKAIKESVLEGMDIVDKGE